MNASSAATSLPVAAPPIFCVIGPGSGLPGRFASLATIGSSMAAKLVMLISAHVGRSTTRAGSGPVGDCRPEVSATGSYARREASLSSATTARAASGSILGPRGVMALTPRAASDQSTMRIRAGAGSAGTDCRGPGVENSSPVVSSLMRVILSARSLRLSAPSPQRRPPPRSPPRIEPRMPPPRPPSPPPDPPCGAWGCDWDTAPLRIWPMMSATPP